MAIDSSKFFDSIRIKPNKQSAKQARAREEAVTCEWPECKNKGAHRAPKGRANDKEYWHFCLNHVREYNQSYNFFSGMNADAVRRFSEPWQKRTPSRPRTCRCYCVRLLATSSARCSGFTARP